MNIPSNQDFSIKSSLLNVAQFELLYQKIINETFSDFARDITLHLHPIIETDQNSINLRPSQQFNPLLGGTTSPITNTRNTGTIVTHRDVIYKAHIKIGPKPGDDTTGIGDLKDNEASVTLAIEALPHINETLSISIEGRRYSILETRPIGFSQRRFLIVKLQEINEAEIPNPDIRIG